MLVVFLVAFAEFIFRLMQVVYAPFYALFIVGPAANMIEIWWESRSNKPPQSLKLSVSISVSSVVSVVIKPNAS